MAILSVISGNLLLWTFLMENFNLGIAKTSVIPENMILPNPVLSKTSVCGIKIAITGINDTKDPVQKLKNDPPPPPRPCRAVERRRRNRQRDPEMRCELGMKKSKNYHSETVQN